MGKVKVVGYSQKTIYNDDIEYRDFTPDLVGQQTTSNNGTSIFTSNNFVVTTNMDPKVSKIYKSNSYSKYYDLSSLESTDRPSIFQNKNLDINFDKSDITKFAYFGSLSEYIRVSLENIINNWEASIFVTKYVNTTTGNTVEDYYYDNILDKSNFKVNTNTFQNNFSVKYLKTSVNDSDTHNNLTVNFTNYELSASTGQFPVIGFTGSTNKSNDYVYIEVEGNPFSSYTESYHIKPQQDIINRFFYTLNEFEGYLLSRRTYPLYTADFKYNVKTDNGVSLTTTKRVTWPVTDGYNIDYYTTKYIRYVNDLLEIANNSDSIKTDLITRFFVDDSIIDFDTEIDEDSKYGKITSLLKIYGREFDEIKKYSDGISYANTVSYDKKNNTPDSVVKNLARTMGWDLSLLDDLFSPPELSTISGETYSLDSEQAEIELWRRVILNTPWIWKSKGTRKAVEFLMKMLGIPNGLFNFDEHLYTGLNKVDVNELSSINKIYNGIDGISNLLVDSDGYPKYVADTPDMYFQKAGSWYRKTGGVDSDIDVLKGNNPHIGPYDRGNEYINQYRCLIPNFSGVTLATEEIIKNNINLFDNYNNGIVDGLNVDGDCVSPIKYTDELILTPAGSDEGSCNGDTLFFDNLNENLFPITRENFINTYTDGSIVNPSETTDSTFWGNPNANTIDGRHVVSRLYRTFDGSWYSDSYCLDVLSETKYYIGFAGGYKYKVFVNGKLLFDVVNNAYNNWIVFPYTFPIGKNILRVESWWYDNEGGVYYGFEVYSANTASEIVNATNETEAKLLWSSAELKDGVTNHDYARACPECELEAPINRGNICPEGYFLDNCDGNPICRRILDNGLAECGDSNVDPILLENKVCYDINSTVVYNPLSNNMNDKSLKVDIKKKSQLYGDSNCEN